MRSTFVLISSCMSLSSFRGHVSLTNRNATAADHIARKGLKLKICAFLKNSI